MRKTRKVWIGIGAFVMAGTGAAPMAGASNAKITQPFRPEFTADSTAQRLPSGSFMVAQHAGHDDAAAGGEEGGEMGVAALPPNVAFSVRIALMRGHLFVGNELVEQTQWNAALPHFLHPSEEIYDDLKEQLPDYKVAPFEDRLDKLADVVKAKKGGADYAKARADVDAALSSAEAAIKQRRGNDWASFSVETAVELLRVAGGEYSAAIENGRIAKPVEYQDARGFILTAEKMIEAVAPELEKKDSAALARVRAGFVDLKKAFPQVMPPKAPVTDAAGLLADISKVELASGRLM